MRKFLVPGLLCVALLWTGFLATQPASAQRPCSPGSSSATASSPPCFSPMTKETRLRDFAKRTVGAGALVLAGAGAGIAQARNHPSAWEQGMEGYGRRYGSRMAQRGIGNTIQLGVEAALGEDSRYYPSLRPGVWGRVKYAMRSSFVARDRQGNDTPPVGRIAGTIGAGLLSRRWQPPGHDGIDDGFRSAGISYSMHVGMSVFREFWPDIRRYLSSF
jgi:hypothetical protein